MAATRNSAQWCALRMSKYLGVTSLTPKPDASADPDDNRTYLAEGDLDDIAGIQTAVLQDIVADGPAYLSNADFAGSLFAPTTVSINVTQGGAGAQVIGWQSWMLGCNVLIAGDGFINEIIANGNTPTNIYPPPTGVTLRRPYLGPTATVSATVFGNSIPLDASIKNVLEPVEIAGGHRLRPCADRAECDLRSGCHFLSGAINTGWPTHFFAETRYNPTQSFLALFLRVAPAPQSALPIAFRAKLNPPMVTVADLGTSTADPGKMLPIPGQWVESIFLPYCLQRLTGHALFKNEAAKPEIARQYKEAQKKLASFKPQIVRQGGCIAFRP